MIDYLQKKTDIHPYFASLLIHYTVFEEDIPNSEKIVPYVSQSQVYVIPMSLFLSC